VAEALGNRLGFLLETHLRKTDTERFPSLNVTPGCKHSTNIGLRAPFLICSVLFVLFRYNMANVDFLFKIVLVGDSCVGKSCLLLRFADD
jgi:hypothetical protein